MAFTFNFLPCVCNKHVHNSSLCAFTSAYALWDFVQHSNAACRWGPSASAGCLLGLLVCFLQSLPPPQHTVQFQLGPGCPLATLSFHRALLILGLAHHVPVGWGWTGSTGPAACPCDSPTPLGCFGAAKAFQLGNQGRKCHHCGETAETVHPGTGLTCCCADIPW